MGTGNVGTGGNTIGQRIVAARKEMGMKQVELAELIHVSQRSMQAYEADEVEPFRKLKELSEVLNVPMSWILHGDKAEKSTGDLEYLLQNILDVLHDIRAGQNAIPYGERKKALRDGSSHSGK